MHKISHVTCLAVVTVLSLVALFAGSACAKEKAKGEIIEIVDLSSGTKLLMLEDGRTDPTRILMNP